MFIDKDVLGLVVVRGIRNAFTDVEEE